MKLVENEAEWEFVKSLRLCVFVEEQGGPEIEEFDEYDSSATHAAAVAGVDGIIGTGRLYLNEIGEAQIGRMAVEREYRRRGVGGLILRWLEDQAIEQGVEKVLVHAQTYVWSFYDLRGYVVDGEPFDEVGIEHIRMTKVLGQTGSALE